MRQIGGVARPNVAWAHVTIDCVDVERVARFWAELLDIPAVARDDGWHILGPTARGGPMIYLQPVEEPKVGKARAHLDLWVDDLDAGIALVEQLGGVVTAVSVVVELAALGGRQRIAPHAVHALWIT